MGRAEKAVLVIVLIFASALMIWAGAVLLAGFGLVPEYGDICEKPDSEGHKNCTSYHIVLFPLIKIAKFLNDYNGLLVAIFTALLWWVSRGQFEILSKSVGIAGENVDSLRRIERAYVFVTVEPAIEKPTGMLLGSQGVKVTFRNRGKTPATLTGFRGALIASNEPVKDFPHDFERNFPRAWAVADAGDFLYPLTVPFSIDAEEIRTGKTTLYCCGVVTYEDIFKKERQTGFCWRYIANEHRFKPADNYELNYQT